MKALGPRQALHEEVDFFRDYCGWPDDRIEARLGLHAGTLAQRKHRARRKAAALQASGREVHTAVIR